MKNMIEDICVYGVGGVGGYFGATLVEETPAGVTPLRPRRVSFIARGPNLDQIRENGLSLTKVDGQRVNKRPFIATADVTEIPTPDLYILTVKSYDLDAAVDALARNITENTIVLPLLNGVDIYDRVRQRLDKGIVLPACVYISMRVDGPGRVTQVGGNGLVAMGKDPARPDYNDRSVRDLFEKANLVYHWSDDSRPAVWEKYLFIAPFGLVTGRTGKTMGEVLADAALTNEVRSIMNEIRAIAAKKGIVLTSQMVEAALDKGRAFPPETRTSFQRDIAEPGMPNEGDVFGETIIRFGRELGIPTPITEVTFNAILDWQ